MDKWVKRAVVGIIVFNILQLCLYRLIWMLPTDQGGDMVSTEDSDWIPPLEPWPAISAFQPWTPNRDLELSSCEAYFGNGFTEEYIVLKALSREEVGDGKESKGNLRLGFKIRDEVIDRSGSFRCFFSQNLRTSVCEGTQLVMDSGRISVSRGGEALKDVIGREEEAELPRFSRGAFRVQVVRGGRQNWGKGALLFDEALANKLMPSGHIHTHTLRSLLLNMETVESGNVRCSRTVRQPTLIVTRFEYANLFHTATDWFSAYISSRIVDLPHRPHVVLLDGHCKSPMDDGWEALFSSVTYAKHFNGPVCFDHAIFAPLGYDTPLFKHIGSTLECSGCSATQLESVAKETDKERMTARLREFGEFFATSFRNDTAVVTIANTKIQEINVLFVRREDYMAHPRHNGKPESRLSNEEQVYEGLKAWADEKSTNVLHITISNGLLAHMTLAEQIKAVKKADVLLGAHGAGLTHLLFAKPSTIVFELSSPFYRRPHFETMSFWMGMDYRVMYMDSSSAEIDEVKNKMNKILEDIKRRK